MKKRTFSLVIFWCFFNNFLAIMNTGEEEMKMRIQLKRYENQYGEFLNRIIIFLLILFFVVIVMLLIVQKLKKRVMEKHMKLKKEFTTRQIRSHNTLIFDNYPVASLPTGQSSGSINSQVVSRSRKSIKSRNSSSSPRRMPQNSIAFRKMKKRSKTIKSELTEEMREMLCPLCSMDFKTCIEKPRIIPDTEQMCHPVCIQRWLLKSSNCPGTHKRLNQVAELASKMMEKSLQSLASKSNLKSQTGSQRGAYSYKGSPSKTSLHLGESDSKRGKRKGGVQDFMKNDEEEVKSSIMFKKTAKRKNRSGEKMKSTVRIKRNGSFNKTPIGNKGGFLRVKQNSPIRRNKNMKNSLSTDGSLMFSPSRSPGNITQKELRFDKPLFKDSPEDDSEFHSFFNNNMNEDFVLDPSKKNKRSSNKNTPTPKKHKKRKTMANLDEESNDRKRAMFKAKGRGLTTGDMDQARSRFKRNRKKNMENVVGANNMIMKSKDNLSDDSFGYSSEEEKKDKKSRIQSAKKKRYRLGSGDDPFSKEKDDPGYFSPQLGNKNKFSLVSKVKPMEVEKKKPSNFLDLQRNLKKVSNKTSAKKRKPKKKKIE